MIRRDTVHHMKSRKHARPLQRPKGYRTTSLVLPTELLARLDRSAKLSHRSRSGQAVFFLTEAVSRFDTANQQEHAA